MSPRHIPDDLLDRHSECSADPGGMALQPVAGTGWSSARTGIPARGPRRPRDPLTFPQLTLYSDPGRQGGGRSVGPDPPAVVSS
jgi:hypothetical protein